MLGIVVIYVASAVGFFISYKFYLSNARESSGDDDEDFRLKVSNVISMVFWIILPIVATIVLIVKD